MNRLLLAVIIIALIAPGCTLLRGQQESIDDVATPVTVALVTQEDISRVATIAGHTEPAADVTVTSKVPGKVLSIPFGVGDEVQSGDVLITLDDEDIRIQVQQAQAAVDIATAQLAQIEQGLRPQELDAIDQQVEQARSQFERAETAYGRAAAMYESGAISRHEYEEAQTHLRMATATYTEAQKRQEAAAQGATDHESQMAEAQLRQAQSQLASVRQQQQACQITAPISGLIAFINARAGEMIGSGMPLVTVVDIDTISITAGLSESNVNAVSVGETLTVHIPSADITATAKVKTISPAPDPQTRLYPMKLELPNPVHNIKPGMYASVEVIVQHASEAIIIPQKALLERDHDTVVYVVEQGKAYLRQVVVGITDGDLAQVKSGLEPGEVIITGGHHYVKDGEQVEITGSN